MVVPDRRRRLRHEGLGSALDLGSLETADRRSLRLDQHPRRPRRPHLQSRHQRPRQGRPPPGPSVKLAVWAVYPPKYDGGTVNATRRLKGPYESPITACLPGAEGQAIHAYDEANAKWLKLESVQAEHEGHICGLHKHDLGLLVVDRE